MINFLCSGRLGDFFHQLYAVNRICKKTGERALIFLGGDNIHDPEFSSQSEFWKPVKEVCEELRELLILQDYIEDIVPYNGEDKSIFQYKPAYIKKSPHLYINNWTEIYNHKIGLPVPEKNDPWIQYEKDGRFENKILIHRTRKTNQYGFPDRCTNLIDWEKIIENNECLFVGFTDIEYSVFTYNFPSISKKIPFIKTPSPLDLVRALGSCRFFIGNQTSPLAIALAMQIPCLGELSSYDSPHYHNEHLYNPNFSWVSDTTTDFHLNIPNGVNLFFNEKIGEHNILKKSNLPGKLV